MFQRFFKRENDANREITAALYAAIMAAARQPHFYSNWDVPDTPLGRFEMISLHMILAMRRLTKGSKALRDVAQELTDMFFTEVDHSLRELGIGDVGVPKRMKKLAKMFYGRAASYGQALDSDDEPALAAALARNAVPENPGWAFGGPMARYALGAESLLQGQGEAEILSGSLRFPSAGAAGE
ncbi:MAG: ubiquinol-cytochrome C chaperone [Rhizobiaceae bacterium]|nr:ubiquinol-cytochrome C chaperone [Rhizobiaceae bacterium]